jgi:hypothetical protein
MAKRDPSGAESDLEMLAGIVALFFYSMLFVEALGITLLVSLTDVTPRAAAVMMVLPAAIVWFAASTRRSLRQGALTFFSAGSWF